MTAAKGQWNFKEFFLIVCSILLVWALLESLMIITEPYLFHGDYQYDPDLGFKVRPYALGSNRFGFNAPDFPLEKPPHTYRILIMGDSFNWSGGHDWNYTVFINKKFQQLFGAGRVEVINAGYLATHTGEQLACLRKYALEYHPDLVFLGFSAGNDFYDGKSHNKRIILNDTFFDIDRRHEWIVFGYPLIPKSRLIFFLNNKKALLQNAWCPRAEATTDTPFFKAEEKHLQYFNVKWQEQGRWRENEAYIFRSLSDMAALLKARKIKFIVGIYPDEFQINNKLFQELCQKYHFRKQDYDLDLAQEKLHRFLLQKNIPYIDLLPKFREVGKAKTLYSHNDNHWNKAGNQLAADVIFSALLPYVRQAVARP